MRPDATPPRLLSRLLAALVPDGATGGSALGDLHEEYLDLRDRRGRAAADLWYLAQTASIGAPWFAGRVRAVAAESVAGLLLDVRSSVRSLRRTPALVAVALLSLSLGAGLTTAAVGLVNAIWFAPLPYADAHRLVDLEDTHPTEVCRGCSPGTSVRSWREWRAHLGGVFERVEAVGRRGGVMRPGDVPVDVDIGLMSTGMWELQGLRTGLGRLPDPEDAESSRADVLVLTHPFWQREFGADPDIVGRVVEIDDRAHTVIGVLEEPARPLTRSDAFRPLRTGDLPTSYGDRGLWVVGRLAPEVDLPAADAALAAFASARYEEARELDPGWSARAVPLRTTLTAGAAEPAAAAALFTLSLLVLLVAATNLAALLLARVTERGRELAVRAALGAGRLRLARAGLTDAAILSTLGGLAGLWVAWIVRGMLLNRFGSALPPWLEFPLDARVLAGTLGVVVLATAMSGILPLRGALGAGAVERGRSDLRRGTRHRLRVHDRLLAVQVVLGLILVTGSAGAFRSFVRVSDFDRLGFRWEGVTNVLVAPGTAPVAELADRLSEAAGRHPGIGDFALTHSLFLGSWGTEDARSPVRADGAVEAISNARVPRHSMAVGPRYFTLFEIPLLAGRPIHEQDRPGAPPAAVVSEDAARVLWPGTPPSDVVGRGFTVDLAGRAQPWQVVGVAAAVMTNPSSESGRTTPRIYTSLAQTPDAHLAAAPGAALNLRVASRSLAPSTAEWARWLQGIAPEASLTRVSTVESALRDWIRPVLVTGIALAGLAALVLVLLVLGIYGTVSYRISSLRRELGVRIALGAGGRDLLHAVLRRLMVVLASSVAVGVALAVVADRLVSFGGIPVGDTDPAILGVVSALVVAVAAGACVGPVRRAMRIDPVSALRAD